MKTLIAIAVMLCSTAALAQSPPPTVGDKPLVQVKPRAAPGKPSPIADRLAACLDIDDGTKERLNCFDAVIAPKPPKPKASAAKAVTDCRFIKEEDQRLTCFNGFAERIPKPPAR
ncbi:MAG TPA: hypothetical protein VIQ05_11780 [Tardiphaga sp.]